MSIFGKVAVIVGLLAVLWKAATMVPFWLVIILAPIWLAAAGIGALAISVGMRWWYDEALAKHDARKRTRHRRYKVTIKWDAHHEDTGDGMGEMSISDKHSTKALLRNVLRLIHQDFILPWYSRISSSSTFPNALDKTILSSVKRFEEKFEKLDIPQLLVAKILPHMTSHMQAYRQVEPFLFPTTRSTSSSQATVDPAPILQSHRKTPLHSALPAPALANPMPSVESHLKRKVEQLLKVVLPPEERGSETVMIIAREVVTCTILMPVVEMLADPDFWNRMLDQQADKHMQERCVVKQFEIHEMLS
jgi:sorting nexin-25